MALPEKVFCPLPWQVAPWRDTSLVVLLTGSAGGGKSLLVAEKLHGFCKQFPGATALALRKKRESMTNSTVIFLEREVIGRDPDVVHVLTKHRFEYANGSILAYGGMADEQQREQIRSIGQSGGVDIAWMEEAIAFTEADFNELLARMRGRAAPWRQVILTTNPAGPRHWINSRLIKGKGAAVYYSKAEDNPHNPPEYLATLDQMTGVIGLRLRKGLWAQSEGVIYDTFDPVVGGLHVRELPGPWKEVIAGLDEGYANPAAIVVVGLDGDDRAHVLDEFYQRRVLQSGVVAEAARLARFYGIRTFYADPSAAGLIADLKAAGLSVEEADNAVFDGIQAVRNRFAVMGDGRPRLTIDPACTNLLAELESYSWKEGRAGVKDEPEKVNDHAVDCLRYALRTYDGRTGEASGEIVQAQQYDVDSWGSG